VQFLKTGRNQHAVVYGSMTEAFNNSTQFMATMTWPPSPAT
jgi:hypothetical protein